jgi:hypothetical protein
VFGQYFFSMNVPAELLSGDAPLRASEPLPAVGPAAPAGRQRRWPEGRGFGERGSPVARPPVAGSPVGRPPAPEPEEQSRGALYRCLYYRQQRLSGVVMVNDKERAKRYEAAVREEWHRDRVEAELPLS